MPKFRPIDYRLLLALSVAPQVQAAEPSKLSAFQPLTVQDAYPTSFGTIDTEVSGRWDRTRSDRNLDELRPTLKWGAMENLQLSVSAPYRFGNDDQSDSGEVTVGGLYQLTKDHGVLPAIALATSIAPPYAERQGTDTDLTFIASKSLASGEHSPRVHLNLSWRHTIDNSADNRENRYIAVIGYSHPLGAKTTLLGDFVREQERERGADSNLLEIGMRHEMAPDWILSVGAGAGIGDDSPQARLLIGVQHSFHLF